jgi:hypothetical protein
LKSRETRAASPERRARVICGLIVLPGAPGSALTRERGPTSEQVTQHSEVVGVGRVVQLDAGQRGQIGEVGEWG